MMAQWGASPVISSCFRVASFLGDTPTPVSEGLSDTFGLTGPLRREGERVSSSSKQDTCRVGFQSGTGFQRKGAQQHSVMAPMI
eukprot:g1829.t1